MAIVVPGESLAADVNLSFRYFLYMKLGAERKLCLFLVLLLVMIGGLLDPDQAAAFRLLIISQQKIGLHRGMVADLRQMLSKQEKIDIEEVTAEDGAVDSLLARSRPELTVTLGSRSLALALRKDDIGPGLFALVSDQALLTEAANRGWRGLPFSVPCAQQLQVVKKLLPEVVRIALIFGPGQRQQLEVFSQAAAGLGFVVEAEMATPRNCLAVIERLYRRCDLFFMFPVPGLINKVTFTKMLELQARTRRPLLGLSPKFVELGASLSVNYPLNAVTGFLAGQILSLAAGESFADNNALEYDFTVYLNPDGVGLFKVDSLKLPAGRIVMVSAGGDL